MEEQNDNVDVLMSLATVYEEQGKEEEALQLVDYGNLSLIVWMFWGNSAQQSSFVISDGAG